MQRLRLEEPQELTFRLHVEQRDLEVQTYELEKRELSSPHIQTLEPARHHSHLLMDRLKIDVSGCRMVSGFYRSVTIDKKPS